MFHIIISRQVVSYTKKIQYDLRKKIFKKIKELSHNPYLGKFLSKENGIELRELKYGVHRIYYYITKGKIQIEDIVYEGKIDVIESGNKNTQQKTIHKLKNRIRGNKR